MYAPQNVALFFATAAELVICVNAIWLSLSYINFIRFEKVYVVAIVVVPQGSATITETVLVRVIVGY